MRSARYCYPDPMNIQIRPVAKDEFEEWSRAEARAFGFHADDEYVERSRWMAELDRTFAAFADGKIVGTATTRSAALTTPGGEAALGFVDDVAVLPTHRRRGVMTRVMQAQLRQMRERGEPFAALSASESSIYERIGYGIATWADSWTIGRPHTAFKIEPNGGGNFQFISADEARAEWPKLHARVAPNIPGMVRYPPGYWKAMLRDAPGQRRGMSEFFHVAYLRGGKISGLASYRMSERPGIERTVSVVFILGEDPEVEAELWRFCFSIDLVTEIRAFNRPTDDPIPWRLEDPRRLERRTHDHMWLRLVDVPAALESRRYDAEGEITIRVHDNFCDWNDGIYRLQARPDGASCYRANSAPEIELSAAELAAAYLGANSFDRLARAGRVRELAPGAVKRVDMLFRAERQPLWMEL